MSVVKHTRGSFISSGTVQKMTCLAPLRTIIQYIELMYSLLLARALTPAHAVVAWSGSNHPLVGIVRPSRLVTTLGLRDVSS